MLNLVSLRRRACTIATGIATGIDMSMQEGQNRLRWGQYMPRNRDDDAREEEFRLRVEEAVKALQQATAEHDRLFTIAEDANTVDGAFAIQQAARIQRDALQRLRTALNDFQAFTRGPQDRP